MKSTSILILSLSILLFSISCSSQEELKDKLSLMPWPKEIKATGSKLFIDSNFTININKKSHRVHNNAISFLRNLTNKTGVFIEKGFPSYDKGKATLNIKYKNEVSLSINVDESYILSIKNNGVELIASTDVGVIRGLSTLLQLVQNDSSNYFFEGLMIKDNPRFKWRGLMIDVSRHFQPVNVIKRNLDAMAFMKMNVFHWHLSDDQGFRIESKVYPKLHQLASDGQYYSHEQIKEIVSYANMLGIRVIPEIDIPGHATAILTAYPKLGSKDNYEYKLQRYAGVFDPTLNPINPEVYTFIDKLFNEVSSLFPDEYFHIGGDENEGKHWDENVKIDEFKRKNKFKDNHDLQTYFTIKVEKILNKYGKKLVGWDEIMTPNMPRSAIIHSWRGKNEGFKNGTLFPAVKKGFKAILSNDYYIDRMFSVDHYYLCDPIGNFNLNEEEENRILGGEVTMWGELVTPLTIDSRIWPRTAAIAERFWSLKNVNDIENMRKRLKVISYELERIGTTHLKNIDVILRNISNNQEINSLKILSKIAEPLKMYERNKGGTEYKSFSPFSLFADACNSDAEDAYEFKKVLNLYKKSKNNYEDILYFLRKWQKGYIEFEKLNKSPILQELQSHYSVLYNVSQKLEKVIQKQTFSKKELEELIISIDKLEIPFADVEIVIIKELKQLANHIYNKLSS